MSVKSVLDKIGEDAKDVFSFLTSAKGEAITTDVEEGIEALVPGATGAITVFNNWFTEILKTQALATAAGAATGSDAQKAALVLQAITPQAVQFAQVNGLSAPTAKTLDSVNSLLVQALNAFTVAPTA